MAVEAALVLPILMVLVFGIIEMSFALRDYASVASLSRAGVRVASTAADRGPATCAAYAGAPTCTPATAPALAQLAADAVQNAGSAMPSSQVNYILVYKANAAGFPGAASNTTMPTTCAGTADCVMYTWVEAQRGFRYSNGTWTSSTISACFPGTATRPLERVGVFVQATHPMFTGLFTRSLTMSDRSVMNFEPVATQTCGAGQHQ